MSTMATQGGAQLTKWGPADRQRLQERAGSLGVNLAHVEAKTGRPLHSLSDQELVDLSAAIRIVEDGLVDRWSVFDVHSAHGQSALLTQRLMLRLQAAWTWESGTRALREAQRAREQGALSGHQWRQLQQAFRAYVVPLRPRRTRSTFDA